MSFKRLRRYLKNREGTAAIEFAILAIPFFMLLFAILELAIIFFISSTLNFAVSEAGRQIRVGNFQSCGTPESFRKLVCANMAGIGACETRLRIDVVSEPTFTAITLPVPDEPPAEDPDDPDASNIENGAWKDTVASAPVVIRGLYYYNLVLPTQLTRLENLEGKGIRVLGATTAFSNEPFPAPGACPTPPPAN